MGVLVKRILILGLAALAAAGCARLFVSPGPEEKKKEEGKPMPTTATFEKATFAAG